jgi:hypothetical protein
VAHETNALRAELRLARQYGLADRIEGVPTGELTPAEQRVSIAGWYRRVSNGFAFTYGAGLVALVGAATFAVDPIMSPKVSMLATGAAVISAAGTLIAMKLGVAATRRAESHEQQARAAYGEANPGKSPTAVRGLHID